MFLLDIKYFILLSIFENIPVLEGLKKVKYHVFTPYRSFYLRNDRRKNDFDYKFKDWETTTPVVFYDFYKTSLKITENKNINKILRKEETVTTTPYVTYSIQTLPTVESLTIVTQEISEVTLKQEVTANTESTFLNPTSVTAPPSSQDTNTTIYVTTSSVQSQNNSTPYIEDTVTLDVSLPSNATIKDLLNWLATTLPAEYTTVIPPPTIDNVENLMPGPTDNILNHVTFVLTTKNPFLEDIEYNIKNEHGYFTTSLRELLIVLFNKTSSDMQKLLTGANTRVESLLSNDAIPVFGRITVEVFQSAIQMLILSPADVRKAYISSAIYSVENRQTAMGEEVNAVFDVIDGIYTDYDVKRIASVLKRIDEFPNNTGDNSLTVATETLNAFIFEPHSRILETAKEKLLLAEINSLLQHRLYPGQNLGRRFMKRKRNDKFTGEWKSRINIPDYHRYSRKQSKYKPLSIHYSKQSLTLRNTKHINIKNDQNKIYWKIAEDKYDVNKIARTNKNSNGDRDRKKISVENLQFHSDTSSESSCSHKESSGYSQESNYNYKSKTVNDKYNFKSDERDFKAYNKDSNRNKHKSRTEINKIGTKHKLIKLYSATFHKLIPAQSAEENILKLNLKHALIHSGKTNNRRKVMNKFNKVVEVESFSDNEAILKSNIYKFLSLSTDFRKKLRTSHILRKTSPA